MLLSLDAVRCIRCACCVTECPASIFERQGSGIIAIKDKGRAHCINCGHCVSICPKAAISLDGKDSQRLFPITPAPLDVRQRAMLFKARRSVRFFKDEPVPHELVLAALDEARYAPTAMNKQNLEWLVIEGADKMYEMGQAMAQYMMQAGSPYAKVVAKHSRDYDPILRKAPMLIIAHAPANWFWGVYDASIAVTTLELALHNRGVGATWAGYLIEVWKECAAKNIRLPHIPLPEGRTLEAALMVGMPSMQYVRVPNRKPAIVQFT